MSWFKLLQHKLDLPSLAPCESVVPFSLTGSKNDAWHFRELRPVSDNRWRLDAYHDTGLEATWELLCFPDTRAVECWGEVRNRGSEPVRGIKEALTLAFAWRLDASWGQTWLRTVNGARFIPTYFPPHDFAIVDRQFVRTPQVVPLNIMGGEDGRTSEGNLPCAILCDEKQAQGMAFFLEWSGLWRITFVPEATAFHERKAVSAMHIDIGLQGLDLDLQPGQSLPLPRVLITAFDGDLEAGGNSLRRHIRRHIAPKLNGQEALPPVAYNHWSAFENDFTAESLMPSVKATAAAGMEYFCVDAAWFEGDFRKGIGNWDHVNKAKFPNGIEPFAQYVNSQGLKYGTWFEPEWAHQDSALYREHPDWFHRTPLHSSYKNPVNMWSLDPQIHLMNFGLGEVREWWLQRIVRAYEEWNVRWIRWDFNQMPRPTWENGVAAGNIGWRQIEHVQGVYKTLDAILEAFPDLFIEHSASGGHRIELGMVRRGHSFWMNDHAMNSDIVRALQHGLNTVLPGNYANTNLSQKRHDFDDYDFLSHGTGGFGYSGNMHEAPSADFERYKNAVSRFKKYRHLLLGDYSRPTGQPAKYDDYAQVNFSDGDQSVKLEWNVPGEKRAASIVKKGF